MQTYSYQGNYILGHFVKVVDSNGAVTSVNPGNLDEAPLDIPFRYESVNEATGAAQRAFTSWRNIPLSDRLEAIKRYQDLLEKKAGILVRQVSKETGKPVWESQLEISETIRLIDFYLDSWANQPGETKLGDLADAQTGNIRYFSKGPVAIIGSADLPILVTHQSLIPSLLFGNSAVFKPSKYSPLSGQILAETFHDAGLPAGVFNLIHGNDELSRRLCGHRDIQCVFFTGSYETGSKLKKEVLTQYWKTVILDMGGKNNLVVWEDAPYEKALKEALLSAFSTTGQHFNSIGNILIHHSLFDRFTKDFHVLAKKCVIDYAFAEKEPFMGPMFCEQSLDNYIRTQGIALREGCEEIMRGKHLEKKFRGYYVTPSIHIVPKASDQSQYQKEHCFGPNVALYSVGDLDEAGQIINMTQYGYVASIYSQDRKNFFELLKHSEVGFLHWNCPTTSPTYKLGSTGIKKSGNSRPMGYFSHFQCTYPVSSLETESTRPQVPDQLPSL